MYSHTHTDTHTNAYILTEIGLNIGGYWGYKGLHHPFRPIFFHFHKEKIGQIIDLHSPNLCGWCPRPTYVWEILRPPLLKLQTTHLNLISLISAVLNGNILFRIKVLKLQVKWCKKCSFHYCWNKYESK